MGILKKTEYPNPTSIFLLFFYMGDLPKINGKIGKKFPNRGEGEGGGSPTWEKFPYFPVFFLLMSLIPDLIRVSDTVSQIPLYSPLYSPQLHLTAHLRNVQLDATKSPSPTKDTAT